MQRTRLSRLIHWKKAKCIAQKALCVQTHRVSNGIMCESDTHIWPQTHTHTHTHTHTVLSLTHFNLTYENPYEVRFILVRYLLHNDDECCRSSVIMLWLCFVLILMEQSPSLEANSCSASQGILCLLWDQKFNSRVYQSPPLVTILTKWIQSSLWNATSLKSMSTLSWHVYLSILST
jgi:hypothetical protein